MQNGLNPASISATLEVVVLYIQLETGEHCQHDAYDDAAQNRGDKMDLLNIVADD